MKVRTNYSRVPYIEVGKIYEAEQDSETAFILKIGDGDMEDGTCYCLFRGCAHLDDNDWEIVE